jgi:hypothetical protein
MSNAVSTPSSTNPQQASETVEKRVVPAWILKLVNPFVKALLHSRWHRWLSGTLMLISYKGRKSGKSYTNPICYFEWDTDELLAYTSGRWWMNVRDGNPVTLLVKGQELEAIPTVIRDREAVINIVVEFIKRLGWKKAEQLLLRLPSDREPTYEELRAKTQGRTFVTFKIVRRPG